jgi:hypothetical protein
MPGFDSPDLNLTPENFNRQQMQLQNELITTTALLIHGKDIEKVKALITQMMLDIREKLDLAKISDDAKPSLELMKLMFTSTLEVCLVELDNKRESEGG